MPRCAALVRPFLALVLAGTLATIPNLAAHAQGRSSRNQAVLPPRPSGPPHAWLFGPWTGGLFPVLDGMRELDCRTPTVIFAQDLVGHTSLTGAALTRRIIETVRTTPTGAEFRFAPEPADTSAFGCEDANVLHVARDSNDAISFPHCAAFPYPLQRCGAPGR